MASSESLVQKLFWWTSAFTLGLVLTGCAGSLKADRAGGASAPDAQLQGFSEAEAQAISRHSALIESTSEALEIDPGLVKAVVWVESRFNEKATSPAGAKGLMQLMPATAKQLAQDLGEPRAKPYDAQFNVSAGAYYLADLIERFDGDERLGIAAYNAGPGNVRKWRAEGRELDDFPQYSQDYVAKVTAARARFDAHPLPAQRDPETQMAAAPATTEAPRMDEAGSEESADEIVPVQSPVVVAAAKREAEASPEVVPAPGPFADEVDPLADYETHFEPHPELDHLDEEPEPAETTPAMAVVESPAPKLGDLPDLSASWNES